MDEETRPASEIEQTMETGIEPGLTLEKDQRGHWAWICEECGWAGFGLFTEHAAHREGAQHIERNHAPILEAESEPA